MRHRQTSNRLGEILVSHGGEYENGFLLGCRVLQPHRSLPKFQRCLLPQVDRPDDGGSKHH
jgi:hypothetical protein